MNSSSTAWQVARAELPQLPALPNEPRRDASEGLGPLGHWAGDVQIIVVGLKIHAMFKKHCNFQDELHGEKYHKSW